MNTMPLEADTRFLIDTNLKNLGWNFAGKNRNAFFEQPKTDIEKKKLGGKRPDYVLYSKDGEPLIVIEAKKKGEKIDAALEQGIYYAKALEAPLVYATDGVFCKSFHTKANRTPILNGEEIDEFIREALALRYLNTWEVNTISSKVQYDRKELIKIFDEANNMLRGDGLRAGIERFGEFANILFLKLISESEQIKSESGIKTAFDTACSWDSIKNIPISTRIDYINKTVYEKLNKLYNTEIFTPLTIRDASILKEIMDKLNPLMLTDVDSDVKGDAFEYFLKESASTKNDLGEYFTPRHIVKTMVRLVNPQIGEKVYDPFCGTGGFLIETFRHIERNMVSGNPKLQKILREETIYGNEITNTARITKMNMILAGDGHSNIHMRDSLANPIYVDEIVRNDKGEVCRDSDDNIELSNDSYNAYDVVITNMPYSQKTKFGSLYDIPSTNGDSICVQHCMKAISGLSENGRMALVVPEGFLFRKDLAKMREYMLARCELQSVISLPQGVFLPYTGVKTNIIYATKLNKKIKTSDKRKNFWYFDVKSDGYSLDNRRRKLDKPSDLSKYEEYRKLDNEQAEDMMKVGFEIIPLDKVRENSYILVGSRYRTNNIESIYKTARFDEFATLTRGVTYQRADQSTVETNTIILPADNVTLSGNLVIEKPIYLDDSITISHDKRLKKDDVFICMSSGSKDHIGKVAYIEENTNYYAGGFMGIIRTNPSKCLSKYLYYYLLASLKFREEIKLLTQGANINNISSTINTIEIPLPPLEKQTQIVNELDSYQKIVKHAQGIASSYNSSFYVNEKCEMTTVGELFETVSTIIDPQAESGTINYIGLENIEAGTGKIIGEIKSNIQDIKSAKRVFSKGNILFGKLRPALNKVAYANLDGICSTDIIVLRPKLADINPQFYSVLLRSVEFNAMVLNGVSGGQLPRVDLDYLFALQIPKVSLVEQNKMLSQMEIEQNLITPSEQIVEVFTKKIHDRIAEVWGNE